MDTDRDGARSASETQASVWVTQYAMGDHIERLKTLGTTDPAFNSVSADPTAGRFTIHRTVDATSVTESAYRAIVDGDFAVDFAPSVLTATQANQIWSIIKASSAEWRSHGLYFQSAGQDGADAAMVVAYTTASGAESAEFTQMFRAAFAELPSGTVSLVYGATDAC